MAAFKAGNARVSHGQSVMVLHLPGEETVRSEAESLTDSEIIKMLQA